MTTPEQRSHSHGAAEPQRPDGVESVIARGVTEGTITSAQAERLLSLASGAQAHPAGRATPGRARPHPVGPLVTEALGYLGGVIVIVGASLVVSQFWADLTDLTRLVVVGGVAAALVVAGALVPAGLEDVGTRLRALLWTLAVGAVSGASSVLFYDILESTRNWAPTLIGAVTAVVAVALWVWRPTILQQAVAAGALALTLGSGAALLDVPWNLAALAVWLLGVLWLGLGWGGVLHPEQAAMAIGAIIAMVGAIMGMGDTAGPALGLTTAVGLVALALHRRNLVLLGIASISALVSLPTAVYLWFPTAVAAAATLILVGALLVGAALYTARRSGRGNGPPDALARTAP